MCICTEQVPPQSRAFLMSLIHAEYARDPVALQLLKAYKKTLSTPDDVRALPRPIYRLLHLEIWILTASDDFEIREWKRLKILKWPMVWLVQLPEFKEWPVPSTALPPPFIH